MKLSDLNIDFIKFKNEKDSFNYKLNDTFFHLKENSLFDSCDINLHIECEKSDSTIKIDFAIDGFISTNCERCLKPIKIAIKSEYQEVLKLTANLELLDSEENYLPVNHQVYNIYDTVYEQICLTMPTRKICETSLSKEKCELNYQSENQDNPVDERWAELKKLIE
ncbi:MAG: DUF177 domain-containing protein [Bacteroidia bacterium]|nr:DUF177 domain-containing protein [Bacteroidia bacterium]NNJ55269.1 DUF177 domain-containing protein [Bacteroidia bacterium]